MRALGLGRLGRLGRLGGLAALAALALAGCGAGDDFAPVDTALYGAGDDWDNPGGDWAESRFSRLTDINADNVAELGLAWEYDLASARVQEATPVVIGGVMYTSGNLGRVYALNAATGEELWTFMPPVDMQTNRAACCDQANRGVAVAEGADGTRDGRLVFVASLDGHLYALNAATGAVVWQQDTITDRARGYTITGAPEVAGNLVVIGNAGAEYDARGYVTAYDLATGKQAWRFWTIPRDPALGPQESAALDAAVETWDPNSRWDIGGGGTVWDAITYDPEFDQVIIGVGNGGPYPQSIRSPSGGDNLYLNSLVALDRKTGELKWHFQETPQDSWDMTATQPMILARMDMGRAGQAGAGERPVVLHAPKNGFFFVVDRETGRPLLAEPMVRTSWASGWNLETGRPILTPEQSDYSAGPKIVFPASPGARNWHPAAFDPTRGLYFANFLDMGNLQFIPPGAENPPYRPGGLNAGSAIIFSTDLEAALPSLPPAMQDAIRALPQWEWVKDNPASSQLRAIDPRTGDVKWAADYDGWQDRSGALATASGLVVHGNLAGQLIVRDADTGAVLKTIETGSSIMAAPMTYRAGGVQYIAVQTGWGGGGWGFQPAYSAAYAKGNANRLLVFRIGGGEVPIPADLPPIEVAAAPPEQFPDATPAMIAEGNALFAASCAMCHSNQPRAPLPDLRRMKPAIHAAFDQIVLEGLLVENAMPRWDDVLNPQQSKAIHAWLIDEQRKLRARELELQRRGLPLDSRSLTILTSF